MPPSGDHRKFHSSNVLDEGKARPAFNITISVVSRHGDELSDGYTAFVDPDFPADRESIEGDPQFQGMSHWLLTEPPCWWRARDLGGPEGFGRLFTTDKGTDPFVDIVELGGPGSGYMPGDKKKHPPIYRDLLNMISDHVLLADRLYIGIGCL